MKIVYLQETLSLLLHKDPELAQAVFMTGVQKTTEAGTNYLLIQLKE